MPWRVIFGGALTEPLQPIGASPSRRWRDQAAFAFGCTPPAAELPSFIPSVRAISRLHPGESLSTAPRSWLQIQGIPA
jgi:hypothetical protein